MSICTITHQYNYAKTKVHYSLQHIDQVKSKVKGELHPPYPSPRSTPGTACYAMSTHVASYNYSWPVI